MFRITERNMQQVCHHKRTPEGIFDCILRRLNSVAWGLSADEKNGGFLMSQSPTQVKLLSGLLLQNQNYISSALPKLVLQKFGKFQLTEENSASQLLYLHLFVICT
jgi:hypothetical protein